MTTERRLDWLFVDGSSLIFRAFYGVPSAVRSPDGRPVNAVRGFMDRLARLVADRQPRQIAVASDTAWRPEWRVELLPSYKAHRVAEPVPPLLEPQLPIIDQVLGAIGIDSVGVEEYEAEDVIASWVVQLPAGTRADVASGDRDLFAVVSGTSVRVLYPEKGGLAEVDAAEIERRYGIPGDRYVDYAILRGDPSDGLPGLRGVGEQTAAGMVRRYGSIAGILEKAPLSDADRDYLARAAQVVPPGTGVPVPLPPGRRDGYPVDTVRLAELTTRHALSGPSERLVQALAPIAGARDA